MNIVSKIVVPQPYTTSDLYFLHPSLEGAQPLSAVDAVQRYLVGYKQRQASAFTQECSRIADEIRGILHRHNVAEVIAEQRVRGYLDINEELMRDFGELDEGMIESYEQTLNEQVAALVAEIPWEIRRSVQAYLRRKHAMLCTRLLVVQEEVDRMLGLIVLGKCDPDAEIIRRLRGVLKDSKYEIP